MKKMIVLMCILASLSTQLYALTIINKTGKKLYAMGHGGGPMGIKDGEERDIGRIDRWAVFFNMDTNHKPKNPIIIDGTDEKNYYLKFTFTSIDGETLKYEAHK